MDLVLDHSPWRNSGPRTARRLCLPAQEAMTGPRFSAVAIVTTAPVGPRDRERAEPVMGLGWKAEK